MKAQEEFIIQPREAHLKKDVCKILVLENTATTVYFQVEDGHEKVRLLHADFEKDYRIIEKIEKEELVPMEFSRKNEVFLLNEKEVHHIVWLHDRFVYYFGVDIDTDYLIKFREIIEKLKTQP